MVKTIHSFNCLAKLETDEDATYEPQSRTIVFRLLLRLILRFIFNTPFYRRSSTSRSAKRYTAKYKTNGQPQTDWITATGCRSSLPLTGCTTQMGWCSQRKIGKGWKKKQSPAFPLHYRFSPFVDKDIGLQKRCEDITIVERCQLKFMYDLSFNDTNKSDQDFIKL